jgi:hypothetical protein
VVASDEPPFVGVQDFHRHNVGNHWYAVFAPV